MKQNINLEDIIKKMMDRKKPGFEKVDETGKSEPLSKWGISSWWIGLITAVIMLIYFFVALPAINPMSMEFYTFFILALVIFNFLNLIIGKDHKSFFAGIGGILLIVLIVIPIILSLFSGPFFHAKRYASLIDVQPGTFSEDVSRISMDQIPIVDREAAVVLGEKQMGQVGELVSQFDIATDYSQINLAGKPIRISPLKYYDLIKYLGNFRNGIQHYISVDMTSQEANLNLLERPIFYSNSDYLMRNIRRHIRFQYPFDMFGEMNFELDDNGDAYYITPVLTKRIFFFGGLDVKGVIITDANTGESTKYGIDEAPEWVDRVFPSELMIRQLDWRGLYSNGFINSVFGQRNVTSTTDGYNYISIGTDIFMVTGVTSVRSDTSNLGFYYVNLRTKETKMYSVPSATEYAAMDSAQGKVQEKDYHSAFPVVLNLTNRPVYFVGLKDDASIAKMFAIVDAQRFENVYIGNTPQEAVNSYLLANAADPEPVGETLEVTITIEEMKQVVIDGNTIYFIKAEDDDIIYVATAKSLGAKAVFLEVGDTIKVAGNQQETQFDILDIK
ncbi:MAG: hypothetical protein GX978_04715 [Tissierellia bacterium]|nr:hypothetical protein [Tissierellia bacterium]